MTESAGATGPGATPEEAGEEVLASFLARNERLLDKVYWFITRRMKDGPDTGGVFEATVKGFVGYAEKRDWGIAKEDYAPLLFTMATRRIIDSHRAHGRTWGLTETAVQADLELLAGAGSDPYEDAICRIDVSRALEQLDERQLQVLTLRAVDGLTLREVAAVVGVSPTSISNITNSATQLLQVRQLLESYGPNRRTTQTGTSEAQA